MGCTWCFAGSGSYNRGGYGLSYSITDIVKWFVAQVSVFQFYTPATIEAYGVGNPNGSLWTISMEIQVYFVIMIVWKWMKKRNIVQWIILIYTALLINVGFGSAYDYLPPMVAKLINITFLPYAYVFLIGMFCYAHKERIIPLISKHFEKILLSYYVWHSFNVLILHMKVGHYTNIITGIFLSVLTISGAYRFGKKRLKQELSYGLYVYHMIIVNALVMFGWNGHWEAIPVVLILTYILAYLSNKFIEKPVMRFTQRKM